MSYKPMPKLSARLKYIRKLHDLSQAELANIAGTTQQAIQQAEKGRARQPRYLHKLAQALDIPVEWMVFGQREEGTANASSVALGLNDKAADVLENFYAMPKKDQELIFELMQSRKKK
jgi:transcriptional regulator with XRE-family HTH domain